jgi:hypothetical protein
MSVMKEQATAEFLRRVENQKESIKKNKMDMLKAASEYENRYKDEIQAGTVKKQKLLTEGKAKGLSEEEVLGSLAVFIPSKNTPILNMLYYMMKEDPDVNDSLQFLKEDKYKNVKFDDLKQLLNEQFGKMKSDAAEQDIPEILEYIYKNVTADIFEKVKKLKALSKSPNKNEAFSAYTKCLELCEKYNLEFDKIRCDVL